jgi:CHAT domain-containing protein
LMVEFHRLRRKEGFTSARALQKAQLELLHDPDERLHQPSYWAPFILIGGHAEF